MWGETVKSRSRKVGRPVRVKRTRRRAQRTRRPVRKLQPIRQWLRYFREMPTIFEWEYILLDEALARYQNKTHAAEALGITREGLRKKLIRMGLV